MRPRVISSEGFLVATAFLTLFEYQYQYQSQPAQSIKPLLQLNAVLYKNMLIDVCLVGLYFVLSFLLTVLRFFIIIVFFLRILLCFSSSLFVLKVWMSPLFIKGYLTT